MKNWVIIETIIFPFPFFAQIQKENSEKLKLINYIWNKDKMMENVPQLTEDQKIIIEALKAQQEKVRTSKRLKGFLGNIIIEHI